MHVMKKKNNKNVYNDKHTLFFFSFVENESIDEFIESIIQVE